MTTMKRIYNYIAVSAVAALGLTACNETIVVDKVDEGAYANVVNLVGTLRDANTNKVSNIVEMRQDPFGTQVAVNFSRMPKKGVDVTVQYDAAYVEAYNKEHGTSFQAYPESKVSLQNGGKIVVAPDEKISYTLDLSIEPFEDKEEATYVLPLKAVTTTDGVKVSETESHLVYLVKNMSWQGSALRKEGQKSVFCYFEVNDTNPLNVLCWETEEGQLLVDYLCLFAYNINYDKEKGEVYCFANPQCQYILDHYDEMIKPLRERGVKVLIGLLGNHDEAGLAQLSEIGAKDFAQKLAALCYGYGFDGVNFDDEYSNGPDLSSPLFAPHSTEAGSRLMFETKKAMPDLLVTTFQYGSMGGSDYMDGIPAGEWLDIAVANYGGAGSPRQGMTHANCSASSIEFARGGSISVDSAKGWAASDYGYVMIFAPWAANNQGNSSQFNSLSNLAEGLLGSRLKTPDYYWPQTKSLETVAY